MQKNPMHKLLSFFWLSFALIAIINTPLFAQGAGRRQVAEGNKHYAENKFDEANDKYRDAEVANPESPIVHFNIGDALYKKRKYEEALQAYQKALQKSDDAQLQAQSHYNIGNTYFRLNKWQESLQSYQEALKLNPKDNEAKYNLEYVRAKIKENAQKQPQDQQQQQKQNQQQQDQQNQQDQQKQDQQQQEQQQKEQQQEEQDQQKPDEQKQQQATQQRKDQEQMKKEDAARLLEALKNQEKEAQKQRQMKVQGRARVDKDW